MSQSHPILLLMAGLVLTLVATVVGVRPTPVGHAVTIANDAHCSTAVPDMDRRVFARVTKDGALTLDGIPIAGESLDAALALKFKEKAERVLFFSADLDAPVGAVVRLLDLAAGQTDLRVVVTPMQGDGGWCGAVPVPSTVPPDSVTALVQPVPRWDWLWESLI